MKKFYITKDTSVDWVRDYNVNALNLESCVFENGSDFCADEEVKIVIADDYVDLADDIDEFGVSNEIKFERYVGANIVYALYSHIGNYLVGYVTMK